MFSQTEPLRTSQGSHAAIYSGYVQYLCEQGADMEARSGLGKTPLHLAANFGKLPVVQYLREQGADEQHM